MDVVYKVRRSCDKKFATIGGFLKSQWGSGKIYLKRKDAEKTRRFLENIQEGYPDQVSGKIKSKDWGNIEVIEFELKELSR